MKELKEQDYINASKELGCEVAAIKAVAEVESAGSGFLSDGQPKILFERHYFSRLTGGKFDKSYPDISYPKWEVMVLQTDNTQDLHKLLC